MNYIGKSGKAPILSAREFDRLLSFVKKTRYSKRDRLLVLMSFGLGLRVMELAGLKVHHILNEDRSIKNEIKLTKTKGKKLRIIYMPDPEDDSRIHDAIKDYIHTRVMDDICGGRIFSFAQPLFISQKGSGFDNKTLQKRFANLYKLAGLHHASSHSGRRTFATTMIENGADIKAVCTLMGHESVNMTAQYVQDNPKRLTRFVGLSLRYI